MTHVLLGEWGFLDNLDDTSGNDLTASANFTPTYIDGPTPGTRAIRFSGVGQTVDYGRLGLEPASVTGGVVTMAWVKLFDDVFGFTDIIHKTRAADSTRHSIDIHDNSVFWMSRWRDQLTFGDSGGPFGTSWFHVCNVDSDDRAAWFINGVRINQVLRSGDSPVTWENFPWVSGESPEMSATDSNPNVAFTGIRIFSGTLSDVEVEEWMETPVLPTGRSGKPKIWSGTAWNQHPAKFWNGSSWVSSPIKGFDGTDWVTAK